MNQEPESVPEKPTALEIAQEKAEKAIPLVKEIISELTGATNDAITGVPDWESFVSKEKIKDYRELAVQKMKETETFRFTWNPWSLVLRVMKFKVNEAGKLVRTNLEKVHNNKPIPGVSYADDDSEAIFDLTNRIS